MASGGFDQKSFTRSLDKLRRGFGAGAERSVVEANRLLAARVRAECPVDTGTLRASTAIGPARRTLLGVAQDVTVGRPGDTRDIVGYVHDGTSRQRANPFFDRAIAATDGPRRSLIGRIVGRLGF